MLPVAILVASDSVSLHLHQAIEGAAAFKTASSLYGFLAKKPGAAVILHYDSFPDTITEIITSITEYFPASAITVTSDHPSFGQGLALLKYGIKGYANSYMGDLHYTQLLKMVQKNNVWLYPEFMQQLISHTLASQTNTANTTVIDRLTPRENEIASLVCGNLSNQEIADQTGITVRTVKQHLTNIYEKLGIKDRLSLALLMK